MVPAATKHLHVAPALPFPGWSLSWGGASPGQEPFLGWSLSQDGAFPGKVGVASRTDPSPGGILPPFIHPFGSEPSPELIPFPRVFPGQPQAPPRSLPSLVLKSNIAVNAIPSSPPSTGSQGELREGLGRSRIWECGIGMKRPQLWTSQTSKNQSDWRVLSCFGHHRP